MAARPAKTPLASAFQLPDGLRSRVVDLDQGSPEWLEWRARFYTASQAPAVLDVNPWFPRTPMELFLLRTGQLEVAVNAYMVKGQDLEFAARQLVSREVGDALVPRCVELEGSPMPMAASLDGVTGSWDVGAEIKVPNAGSKSKLWLADEAPVNYLAQMAHQLICTPALDEIGLWAYADDLDEVRCVELLKRKSSRAADIIERVWRGWLSYDHAAGEMVAPQAGPRDRVKRDDAEWQAAEKAWQEAKARADEAADVEAAAKKALVDLAQAALGATVSGGIATVFRTVRAGNIDWKAAPIQKAIADAGVNPDDYRGKSITSWSVRQAGKAGA